MRYIRTTLAALAVLALSSITDAQTITDLNQVDWIESTGRKINNSGQVIGDAFFEDFTARSFFWDGNTMHIIGAPGSDSLATDLNDSGQVVGSLFDGGQLKPFVFQNGTLTILENLGGSIGDALDINNTGQVTGYSRLAGDTVQHAFIYNIGDPFLTDIDTLGNSFSEGLSINEAGQVMGHFSNGGPNQVFRFSGGMMTGISVSPGVSAFGVQMNESGAIVGDITTGAVTHAFVATGNTAVDLGTLGGTNSAAVDINDSGVVIGNSQTGGTPSNSGFSWNGGALVPLPYNARAVDINNLGDILADDNNTVIRFRGADEVTADLGGPFAQAIALNEQGHFIGFGADPGFNSFGFRYDSAGIQVLALGGQSSDASDINDSGAVTGQSWNADNTEIHAYIAAANAGPADTTAPESAGALSTAPNAAGWNNADVTLNLSATDEVGGSGVKEIRYSVNGGSEVVVSGAAAAIPFTVNGIYSVQFFAVDNAGNAESAQSFTVKLDEDAATTTGSLSGTPNAAGWFNTDVTLNMNASDTGGSGVKEIRYSVNNAAFVPTLGSSASKLFNSDGIFNISFWSIDNADNEETPQESAVVMLDKTAPVVTVSNVPFILEPPNNKMRDVTVSGSITDNLSGIVSASFSVHDEYGMVQPSGSVTVNPNGSYSFVISLEASRNGFDQDGRLYTISVKGTDAAGNMKITQSTVVVPH